MTDQSPPLHQQTSAAPATQPARQLPKVNVRGVDASAADWPRIATLVALAVILLLGAWLRFSNQNWDQAGAGAPSGHIHPDERFLTQISVDTKAPSGLLNYFDTDTSALNPYNITRGDGSQQGTFVYGTLPLFVTKFVGSNLETMTFGIVDNYDTYDTYNLAGRSLAALFDIGTIVFIFLLGCRLAGTRTGLVAAFLYAFAPFAIQNSHFYIVDPFMTFFVAGALYFAVRVAQLGGYWNLAAAGVMAGLAMACKTTAIALLPVIVLSAGIAVWPSLAPFLAPLWRGQTSDGASERDGRKLDRAVISLIAGSAVALFGAFVAYRIAMPYAFNAPSVTDWFSFQTGHIGPIPFPYPDIMNQHWIDDQANQRQLLDGSAFPPNVQWIGRSPWVWPAQQMIIWGMGPAFGIVAWSGIVFAAIYAVWKRAWAWLVPLAWVLGYFFFMGMQFSLYMRYFLPLYPALAVMAGFLLIKTLDWGASAEPFGWLSGLSERARSIAKPIALYGTRAAVIIVLAMTAAAGLAFYNQYDGDHTRVEASKWFYDNVPAGSVIGHEHWDDEVPFGIAGYVNPGYESVVFENYNADTSEKIFALVDNIDRVDYIVLASDRLAGHIPRVPASWPVTSRYYDALQSGELGFEKVAEFTSHPEIFGVEFNDDTAEESFTVYDHPRVRVYKKSDDFDLNHAIAVIGADAAPPLAQEEPKEMAQNAMLFKSDVLERVQNSGTWDAIFDSSSIMNRFPMIFWLLAIELAAFSLVPLAVVVFRGLPDRGFLLTKPLGVLLLSYIVYAPASFGVVDFERTTIALGLALMLVVGAVCLWRWWSEIATFVRERWRFLLVAQGMFLAVFLFGYWLRMQNPDLWHPGQGGEKPMDMAYYTACARSVDMTQGCLDPWNAGGYLNYYYFGQFISATITKLVGVVPEIGYNLVVPMYFALAAAAVFSVAYNFAEGTRRMMRRRPDGTPISLSGPIICAMLAVFLVLIAGNLKAVDVLATDLSRVSPWHPDTPVIGPLVTILGGMLEVIKGDASLRGVAWSYDWWDPSRALDVNDPSKEVTPITEFPFWTFLFADLHAHLMAIPFSLTAVGVALGVITNFTRLNPQWRAAGSWRSREAASWAMVVLLAVTVGALRWINSWDYPPFLLLAAAAILIAERQREHAINMRMLAWSMAKIAVMGLLSYAFYARFAANYHAPYTGSAPVIESVQTTAVADFLSHWGILLVILGGFLVVMLHRALTHDRTLRTAFAGAGRSRPAPYAWPALGIAALAFALVIWQADSSHSWMMVLLAGLLVMSGVLLFIEVGSARDLRSAGPIAMLVGLFLGLGVLLVALWDFTPESWDFGPEAAGVIALSVVGLFVLILLSVRALRSPSPLSSLLLFLYAMIGLGFGLTASVDIWTFNSDIGRMNTVFKFYLHVWLLWGIAASYGAWYILAVLRPQRALARRAAGATSGWSFAPRYVFAAIVLFMLALAMVYPYFGTRARIHSRFDPAQGTGINGMEFMDDAVYPDFNENTGRGGEHVLKYDRDAITWLRDNVDGTPTIIEGVTPIYHWGNRISVYTGLPAVSGWQWHQTQQRQGFQEMVDQRHLDINAFYESGDVSFARDVIKKYDIEYVIVGTVERAYYPNSGLDILNGGLDGSLELVYSNPGTQIWRVIPDDELSEASASAQ